MKATAAITIIPTANATMTSDKVNPERLRRDFSDPEVIIGLPPRCNSVTRSERSRFASRDLTRVGRAAGVVGPGKTHCHCTHIVGIRGNRGQRDSSFRDSSVEIHSTGVGADGGWVVKVL